MGLYLILTVRRWILRNQSQDMRPSACSRHFRGLVIVPFLAVMLAFPATAQTNSESGTPSTGTAGARTQSTGGPTDANPATPKTGSDAATRSTESNSTVATAKSQPSGIQLESDPGTKKSIVISIDKTKQKMTVSIDGAEEYDWPVSTGRLGYSTPSGTYTPTSMNEVWYSKQWDNSPMPHSIFFMKDGHAIHGSYEVKTLGKAVSHGCVRISPQNATTLYHLVRENGLENTQVVLTGVTPGGESRYGQADSDWDEPVDSYYAQLQWRPGWRSFDGPHYNGRQGYYAPPPPVYYAPRRY